MVEEAVSWEGEREEEKDSRARMADESSVMVGGR